MNDSVDYECLFLCICFELNWWVAFNLYWMYETVSFFLCHFSKEFVGVILFLRSLEKKYRFPCSFVKWRGPCVLLFVSLNVRGVLNFDILVYAILSLLSFLLFPVLFCQCAPEFWFVIFCVLIGSCIDTRILNIFNEIWLVFEPVESFSFKPSFMAVMVFCGEEKACRRSERALRLFERKRTLWTNGVWNYQLRYI